MNLTQVEKITEESDKESGTRGKKNHGRSNHRNLMKKLYYIKTFQ